jgi:ribonuclease HII
VIAKTTRDRMMAGPAHATWPQFGFARHVGYATRDHQAALRANGLSPLHRRSFKSVAYPELHLFEGDGGVSTVISISNAPAM